MSRTIIRRLTLIAVVMAIIIQLTWQSLHEQKSAAPSDEGTEPGPDYTLHDARLIQFDENGRRVYTAFFPYAEHYLGEDRTHITKPQVEYLGESPLLWQLKANHGVIDHAMSQILMREAVQVDRSGIADQQPLVIQMPSVLVDLDRHIASCLEGVHVETGPYQLTAIEMIADIQSGDVELRRKVRGWYTGL